MIKVYANLIMKGKKVLDDVPLTIREQVYEYLVEIGYYDNPEN